MCGIAGVVSRRVLSDAFLHEIIPAWVALLQHRGPDEWGWYRCSRWPVLLFHRRLAITGIQNGQQPLPDERKTLWLSYNGEIYNYLDLREALLAKGHRFRSDTDGEVILHLFKDMGMRALESLNGDFAFALYDAGSGKLFLARDRFGVKPLYYAVKNGALYFSSEIKGIFADPAFPRAIDGETLQNHLQTFYFAEETIFQDVRQLKPGHYLSYDLHSGSIQISTYWNPPFRTTRREEPEADLVEEFRQRFTASVRQRIPGEVQVGAYLSGGLDSSAIVQTMKAAYPEPFPVFSIGFNNKYYNELTYTEELVRSLDLSQFVVQIGKGGLKHAFLKSLWHSEIPVLNTHGAAKQLLAVTARQHCKVVLTGEGADELLMGYGLFAHLHQAEHTGHKKGKASVLGGQLAGDLKQYQAVKAFFGAYPYAMQRHFYLHQINRWLLAGQYRQASGQWDWRDAMRKHFEAETFAGLNSPEATQLFFLRADFPAYLLNYLGDRQEMSASLEGRVPFLDHTLAEFMCALPYSLKFRDTTVKYILREAMRGQLGESLRLRPKQVFYAPAFESLGYFDDPGFFRPFTNAETFKETGVFNPLFYQALIRLIRLLPAGHRLLPVAESVAVFVLSLHIVYDLFIRKFDYWQKQYAPSAGALPLQDYDVGKIYAQV
ncbi:MAG: asparagine synthase (glutamine-hydrolyzing) [Phaeodactylibacter sp.]|nr:asparagine synthase (glutamine-hydrolyzing) [Phaeodactylibacter sp.]